MPRAPTMSKRGGISRSPDFHFRAGVDTLVSREITKCIGGESRIIDSRAREGGSRSRRLLSPGIAISRNLSSPLRIAKNALERLHLGVSRTYTCNMFLGMIVSFEIKMHFSSRSCLLSPCRSVLGYVRYEISMRVFRCVYAHGRNIGGVTRKSEIRPRSIKVKG